MKIPHRIKIKNKVYYEVVFIESFTNPLTLAECRYTDKQIVIKKGQSKNETLSCFVHEITHAICFERRIKITHKAVYGLEKAVLFLIKANKWI